LFGCQDSEDAHHQRVERRYPALCPKAARLTQIRVRL
jgi:hypothetical protein